MISGNSNNIGLQQYQLSVIYIDAKPKFELFTAPGEYLEPTDKKSFYKELLAIPNWRQVLSSTWSGNVNCGSNANCGNDGNNGKPIFYNNLPFATQAHAMLASNFSEDEENAEFFEQFSLQSQSEISTATSITLAKSYAGRVSKARQGNEKYKNIKWDKSLLKGEKEVIEGLMSRKLKQILSAKYEDEYAQKVLLATRQALLVDKNHRICKELMAVREHFRKMSEGYEDDDCDYDSNHNDMERIMQNENYACNADNANFANCIGED